MESKKPNNRRRTGIVISDLHMFASHSYADTVMPTLRPLLKKSSALVLNGDIFDFKWSTFTSVKETMEHSLNWLTSLISEFKHTEIHYVAGNYEYFSSFSDALQKLEKEYQNFFFHPELLKLGENLFIHGDVCNWKRATPNSLHQYRLQFGSKGQAGTALRIFYGLITLFRLHKAVYLVHNKKALSQKLYCYLKNYYFDYLKGTKSIYFGHTHTCFDAYHYNGIKFYNTGAAIKGLKSRIFQFEY